MSVIDVSSDMWERDVVKSTVPVVVEFGHEQCV